jgi:hypothetical protein
MPTHLFEMTAMNEMKDVGRIFSQVVKFAK